MADLNIAAIRQQYPQYHDMSDAQLAQGLHDKFYSDMPFSAFANKIGYAPAETAPNIDTTATEFGQPYAGPVSPEPAPGNAAVERIGSAAAQAYRDTPSVLTPKGENLVNDYTGPIGKQLINPAVKVIGGLNAGAHAGMAAISQAAMETFGERGGRDVLAFLATLPALQGERMSPYAPTPEAPAPRPRTASELYAPDVSELDPRNAISTLIQHDINENGPGLPGRGEANQGFAAPPQAVMGAPSVDTAIAAARDTIAPTKRVTVGEVAARDGVDANEAYRRMMAENAGTESPRRAPEVAPALPWDTGPEPGSLSSAATPGELTNMSAKDMKANRYQAEMGELLGPPQANDTTIYVKGSYPTLAERRGDPEISQQENLLRQRNPAAFIGDGKRLTENNRARVAAFDDQTPSRTAIDMMKDNRDAQWQADSQSILPNAKPADLTPALDWVQGQLGDPRVREVDAVRSILENFHDRLIDEDGNLKSDPAAIWGIHDNIQNQLSKAKDPLNATGAEKYAFSELMAAKKIVDGVMNEATGNQFQTALDNYAKASQEINAGEALEKFRPRLTNASGEVQAANFHRFVIGLADLRGRAGIDPAMSISDDAMRTLINIDNDLKRAGLIRMGAAAGSPTNLLGALAEKMGMGAVHMAGGGFVTRAVAKVGMDLVAQHRLEAMTNKHLAPPEGGYMELTP